MPRISAFFTNNGTPIAAPATAPTIRIRRQDTGALVVTDLAMTEQGDGIFTYDFAEDPTLEYVFRCDGDPIVAGQVTIQERYVAGSFSGITEARIHTDIPAILVDTDVTIPGRLTGIEGAGFLTGSDSLEAIRNQGDAAWLTAVGFSTHSAADVWAVGTRELTALTAGQLTAIQSEILNDGTPFAGADIDAAITTRATQADILADATPFNGADIADILLDTGTTIPGLIAALPAVVASDVWDELLSGHVIAGSAGEALTVILDIVAGDTRIVNSGLDWVEEHLDYATGLIVRRRYDLFGFDAGQITDTNNPFTASGISRDTGFMSRVRTL